MTFSTKEMYNDEMNLKIDYMVIKILNCKGDRQTGIIYYEDIHKES